MNLAAAFDVVALVGFLAALVLAVATTGPDRRLNALGGALCVAAMLIMSFVSLSNLVEDLGINTRLDVVEDVVEVIVFPLMGYALYAITTSDQMEDLRSTINAARAEHEMLMGIVDTSPVGIAVVDDRGHATFANKFAWELLELRDCDGPWNCVGPGVVVPKGAALPEERALFDRSLLRREFAGEHWEFVTPKGRHPLLLSSTPLKDPAGKVLGSVAVFHTLTEAPQLASA